MKLEIYQVGKVPPLTVVECDCWYLAGIDNERLECVKNDIIVAMFLVNNIAGFKIADFEELVGEDQ